ncbi:MAG: sensor histidine kinase [Woeseia sp.]|nr:sensor histidine kinase [Woeseia sp.]NNE60993.1 sensor histidine kinase [Woeseia sp.]NNL55637.1 sensor histidine kinase [Woeseia sp.]
MKVEHDTSDSDVRSSLGDIVLRVQQMSAENEELVKQLANGEFRFRRLAKAVWRVQEEERRNIALELHDGIGQVLTALINQLQHATYQETTGAGSDSVELAKSALSEVRRMSRALRPSVLDDLGLVAALKWLGRTTGESSGLEVMLEVTEEELNLDPQTETLVFRIVQEALTNIIKHAGATRSRVVLGTNNGALQVAISDNGKGFDASGVLGVAENGFGVRGMRDRAELFGGKLDVKSAPNEGTLVTLTLPETSE